MPIFKKKKKLMSGFQTTMVWDRHTDGQTWIYRTLPAEAGAPKIRVKQIKTIQEKWSQRCNFCRVFKEHDPINRDNMQQKNFFCIFTTIYHISVWIWFVQHVLFFLNPLDSQLKYFTFRTKIYYYKVCRKQYHVLRYISGIDYIATTQTKNSPFSSLTVSRKINTPGNKTP